MIKFYQSQFKSIFINKKYLGFALLIFMVGMVLGFLITFSPEAPPIKEQMIDTLKSMVKPNYIQTLLFIIQHNLTIMALAIVLGTIGSIFLSFFNGVAISFLMSGEKPFMWLYLLPHGIFELTAFFIAFGYGLKIGIIPFKKQDVFKEALIIFTSIILPLTILAGVIETTLIFL